MKLEKIIFRKILEWIVYTASGNNAGIKKGNIAGGNNTGKREF